MIYVYRLEYVMSLKSATIDLTDRLTRWLQQLPAIGI
uniref:Uncharacterized protein n=1 Tax=Zea mays subsp. mays TaxID=381124 RepID=A0A166VC81_MAIZE|nr:hypothetical protein GRMZM2G565441.1 [Zea mays subsp. mays]ANA76497.1 hypothetical protein GRMZM2G565441.2 [Zea mays subsp. mays]ANA76501.1 hypothetical protein GRMZM2G565441.1 [Zea mays subsp. mays]